MNPTYPEKTIYRDRSGNITGIIYNDSQLPLTEKTKTIKYAEITKTRTRNPTPHEDKQ